MLVKLYCLFNSNNHFMHIGGKTEESTLQTEFVAVTLKTAGRKTVLHCFLGTRALILTFQIQIKFHGN